MEEVFENQRGANDLIKLIITDEGFLKINEYRNRIEPHLADGGKYSHLSLRGAASKIDIQIMKIASALHLLDIYSDKNDHANIQDRHVESAIEIAHELLEANLRICQEKGIIGVKAEYISILSLFEKNQQPRTERNIITVKVKSSPFKDFTGNRSALIRKTIAEMVGQNLLSRVTINGKPAYQLGQ
jgi:hypothetical protein